MVCPSCLENNRESASFCVQCGNKLRDVCTKCYTPIVEGDIFCQGCGAHLQKNQSEIPQSSLSALLRKNRAPEDGDDIEAERKTVTVLFADLSGFTSMSEKLDPEDVTALMNRCLSIMGEIVLAYEGYIDKFIGDCIMAIFGAPITHENDPELAIRSALAMKSRIDELNKELPIKIEGTLSLHIGINTGLVVAGKMGSESKLEYTVMGDTVNLASRLEAKARGGQIFISAYTYNQVKNLFEFIEHEPIEVKGKRDPIAVYEVVRALKDDEVRFKKSFQIPLVGRSRELEILFGCAKKFQEGQGQAIFLVSDPGFGKSRIQAELRKQFEHGSINVIDGHCYSYGRHTPYHVFIDVFRRLLGIDADDMPEAIEEKIVANMPLLLEEEGDRLSQETKKAIVLIGKIFGIDVSGKYDLLISEMSPQELQSDTIMVIGWIFSMISKKHPTVLNIEDLHYADAATVEVVSHLIHLTKENKFMLLMLLRPEKASPASKLEPLSRRLLGERAVVVTFERLNRDECELFVKKLLEAEELPRELVELVGSRSDGNPLFLQEIVRSLIDNGAIKKDSKNRVTLQKDIKTISIPSSINGLIMARVDQLTHDTRELLAIASAIGQSFTLKLLNEITSNMPGLDAQLNRLVEAELIFESQTFPELEYTFHTTFIQEAIYDTILLKRRRAMHKQIAQAMVELFGEHLQDHVESLAHHYYEANDFEKAFEFTIKCAYKAKNAYANDIALEFFKRAIELCEKLNNPTPSLAELQEALSQVFELTGDLDGALASWQCIYDEFDDAVHKSNALRNMGRILEKQGLKEESIAYYEHALELIKEYPESLEYGLLLINYSWMLNRFKQTKDAIEKANSALLLFEKLQNQESIALSCNNLAVFYEELGEFDTALEYNQKSLAIFLSLKQRRQIGNVELSLGYLRIKRGEMEMALESFTRSSEAMDRIGNRLGNTTALLAKGRCYASMKRYIEAESVITFALKEFQAMNMDRRVVATQISLITVLFELEKIKDVMYHIDDALEISARNGYDSDIAKLYRLYGRALRLEWMEKEAEGFFEKAIELFKKIGYEKDAEETQREKNRL